MGGANTTMRVVIHRRAWYAAFSTFLLSLIFSLIAFQVVVTSSNPDITRFFLIVHSIAPLFAAILLRKKIGKLRIKELHQTLLIFFGLCLVAGSVISAVDILQFPIQAYGFMDYSVFIVLTLGVSFWYAIVDYIALYAFCLKKR